MIRVTALQFAPSDLTVSRGNAAPREEREFAALTPGLRCSHLPAVCQALWPAMEALAISAAAPMPTN